MQDSLSFTSSPVPLKSIDRADRLTDFSLSPAPEALVASIAEIGLLHPLVLTRKGDGFRVVAGHRRVDILTRLKVSEAPARVLQPSPGDATLVALNLIENSGHRSYSDVEKGCILFRLKGAGASERELIEKYMPFLGLERSKKYCEDFLATGSFSDDLQSLLHELNLPIRVFSVLFRWDEAARGAAMQFLKTLRPGVNKARELLMLADECAGKEGPADLLSRSEILSPLNNPDLNPAERYEAIHRQLTAWRYPDLTGLRRKVAQALDRLNLDPRTRIRFQDTFESDELKVEMKFRDRESLDRQVKKLDLASRSPAIEDLLRIFKSLE